MGGRAIIHARCHGCESNLLAEVMEMERQIEAQKQSDQAPEPDLDGEQPDSPPAVEPLPDPHSDDAIQPERS